MGKKEKSDKEKKRLAILAVNGKEVTPENAEDVLNFKFSKSERNKLDVRMALALFEDLYKKKMLSDQEIKDIRKNVKQRLEK
ncbi:MAG: hypothetical protein IKP88_16035 [Lachnospiraceae bacterium]|nr:hypothetical protein [Lachnospiraceae bacterium]